MVLLATNIAGCSGDNPEPVGPASRDRIDVEHNITLQGNTYTLKVDANCSWEITNTADWLTITPTSGTGLTNVTLTGAPNSSTSSRTANLTLKTGDGITTQISVLQAPGEVVYSLNADNFLFDKAGETKPLIITSNTSWTLTGTEGLYWLSCDKTEGEPGTTTVNLTASANNRPETQTATLVLTLHGTTDETRNIPVSLQGSSVEIRLSEPDPAEIPAVGGTSVFSLQCNYNWNAEITGGTWAKFDNGQTITTGDAVAAPTSLSVTGQPNTSQEARQVTLTLTVNSEQQTRTLWQAAGTLPQVGTATTSNVLNTQATLTFSVSSTTFPVTIYGAEVSTNSDMQDARTQTAEEGEYSGTVTLTVSSLISGQTYYVRPFATNAVGRRNGGIVSFTTLAIPGSEDNPTPYVKQQ